MYNVTYENIKIYMVIDFQIYASFKAFAFERDGIFITQQILQSPAYIITSLKFALYDRKWH